MLRSLLSASLLGLIATGCIAARVDSVSDGNMRGSSDASAPDKADADADDKEWKLVELRQKHELAESRLEVAQLQLASFESAQKARLTQARKDLELAERELAKFRDGDRPARIASAELNLQSTKDRAQEAADELAQIEIMYKDQDLNDKTAEFVVARGRRSAERAAARIAIQEAEFKTLIESEMPMTAMRLETALEGKRAALDEAERDADIGMLNKQIALREAQQAVEKAAHELADAGSAQ